ncbi:protein of unknown function [Mariniphaga anaerophila]|uniref:DUF4268 domain-containing protein n=1 Tax=Mariniphaga anaerophila TaxID=1484053 RepID=A0A1M5AQX7_9BACT|nr:DUF4268 domain-containing protein [Mariniphaga anaerophila]SHF32585.1 protein of unknown function [Mariniphaga anaerophila]
MYSKEEAKKIRLQFWTQFGKRCEIHPLLRQRQKKWMLHRTKIQGVALRFEADRNDAKVILELSQRSEDKRLKAFEVLQNCKVILEDGFSDGLLWEFFHEREDSGQQVCRIYNILPHVNMYRQKQWPDIFNFFIENMSRLEENFLQIRDVLQEEMEQYSA